MHDVEEMVSDSFFSLCATTDAATDYTFLLSLKLCYFICELNILETSLVSSLLSPQINVNKQWETTGIMWSPTVLPGLFAK